MRDVDDWRRLEQQHEMDANWESVTDELIRQLERNATWNSFAAPCRGCALAASELRLMRQRVDGLLALLQEVKAYIQHIRRQDGSSCRCDVCGPVNDLIAQIDRASEGEP